MPDGTMVDWNYDTVRQVAMLLTIDKAGKNATQAGLRSRPRSSSVASSRNVTTCGAWVRSAGAARSRPTTADRPDPGRVGDGLALGIRRDLEGPLHHARPGVPEPDSSRGYTPSTRATSRWSENFLWSVCCLTDAGGNWNLAALPSYNGRSTAPINADTFRITKDSKHPDEAFEFLAYLLGDARPSC